MAACHEFIALYDGRFRLRCGQDNYWDCSKPGVCHDLSHGGQWIVSHQRAFFLDCPSQVYEGLSQRVFAGDIEQIPAFCPDPRVRQQVLDQPLHAASTVHGEGNKLIRIGVQLSFVTSGQELRVTGHHPQRFLQIVGCDISKLPQFLSRTV